MKKVETPIETIIVSVLVNKDGDFTEFNKRCNNLMKDNHQTVVNGIPTYWKPSGNIFFQGNFMCQQFVLYKSLFVN